MRWSEPHCPDVKTGEGVQGRRPDIDVTMICSTGHEVGTDLSLHKVLLKDCTVTARRKPCKEQWRQKARGSLSVYHVCGTEIILGNVQLPPSLHPKYAQQSPSTVAFFFFFKSRDSNVSKERGN